MYGSDATPTTAAEILGCFQCGRWGDTELDCNEQIPVAPEKYNDPGTQLAYDPRPVIASPSSRISMGKPQYHAPARQILSPALFIK